MDSSNSSIYTTSCKEFKFELNYNAECQSSESSYIGKDVTYEWLTTSKNLKCVDKKKKCEDKYLNNHFKINVTHPSEEEARLNFCTLNRKELVKVMDDCIKVIEQLMKWYSDLNNYYRTETKAQTHFKIVKASEKRIYELASKYLVQIDSRSN